MVFLIDHDCLLICLISCGEVSQAVPPSLSHLTSQRPHLAPPIDHEGEASQSSG